MPFGDGTGPKGMGPKTGRGMGGQRGFNKPGFANRFGRGFAWQGKGRFKGLFKEAEGKGPEGYCVCPKCGYKEPHKRGVPCPTIKCPKCGTYLTRK